MMNPTVLLIAAWLVQVGGVALLLGGVAWISMKALDLILIACKTHRIFILFACDMLSGTPMERRLRWKAVKEDVDAHDALMANSDRREREAKERWQQMEQDA